MCLTPRVISPVVSVRGVSECAESSAEKANCERTVRVDASLRVGEQVRGEPSVHGAPSAEEDALADARDGGVDEELAEGGRGGAFEDEDDEGMGVAGKGVKDGREGSRAAREAGHALVFEVPLRRLWGSSGQVSGLNLYCMAKSHPPGP